MRNAKGLLSIAISSHTEYKKHKKLIIKHITVLINQITWTAEYTYQLCDSSFKWLLVHQLTFAEQVLLCN